MISNDVVHLLKPRVLLIEDFGCVNRVNLKFAESFEGAPKGWVLSDSQLVHLNCLSPFELPFVDLPQKE